MQVRYVQHGDYQFCYSFRGRPGPRPSLLLLHGFSAHKDMWLSLVKVRRGKGFHLEVLSSAVVESKGDPDLWLRYLKTNVIYDSNPFIRQNLLS